MKLVIALAIIVVSCGSLGADECKCGGEYKVAGPSFKVHGRISGHQGGWPNRIWIVGTNRVLGIPEFSPLPENLDSLYIEDYNEVYGDFTVCPLTRYRPGEMQIVCVVAASHLRVHEFASEPVTVRDLPGCYIFRSICFPISKADTFWIRPDSMYRRVFVDTNGVTFSDSGSWNLRQVDPTHRGKSAELEFPNFVVRFSGDGSECPTNHLLLVRDHQASDTAGVRTLIPMWKESGASGTSIVIGHPWFGWEKRH